MPLKTHQRVEIVAKLQQADLSVSQGQQLAETVRSIGLTQFTYDRSRKG